MTYAATLDRSVTINYQNCPLLPAQVVYTVQAVTGFVDKGIFVYKIDPDTSVLTYSHVAQPCDINQYPFNNLSGDFTRTADATIIYPNAATADAGIAATELAVQDLCDQMERISVLDPPATIVITS